MRLVEVASKLRPYHQKGLPLEASNGMSNGSINSGRGGCGSGGRGGGMGDSSTDHNSRGGQRTRGFCSFERRTLAYHQYAVCTKVNNHDNSFTCTKTSKKLVTSETSIIHISTKPT